MINTTKVNICKEMIVNIDYSLYLIMMYNCFSHITTMKITYKCDSLDAWIDTLHRICFFHDIRIFLYDFERQAWRNQEGAVRLYDPIKDIDYWEKFNVNKKKLHKFTCLPKGIDVYISTKDMDEESLI